MMNSGTRVTCGGMISAAIKVMKRTFRPKKGMRAQANAAIEQLNNRPTTESAAMNRLLK